MSNHGTNGSQSTDERRMKDNYPVADLATVTRSFGYDGDAGNKRERRSRK